MSHFDFWVIEEDQCPKVAQEKVEVIQDFPRPTTVKKLQQFLGLVIFYHRVVSLAATILSPLHDLKGTKKTSHKPLQWPPVTNAVFMQVKNKLTGLALLAHSVLDAPTVLTNEDDATSNPSGNSIQGGGLGKRASMSQVEDIFLTCSKSYTNTNQCNVIIILMGPGEILRGYHRKIQGRL
ncbi:uncharacterized protein LOC135108211 [Scylla paramamosain]|uniref:uncharacterized protein LOC135108211 n=1 Tax=Scylla paramamosain TaxID=85552 RepID=UPI003082FF07